MKRNNEYRNYFLSRTIAEFGFEHWATIKMAKLAEGHYLNDYQLHRAYEKIVEKARKELEEN